MYLLTQEPASKRYTVYLHMITLPACFSHEMSSEHKLTNYWALYVVARR